MVFSFHCAGCYHCCYRLNVESLLSFVFLLCFSSKCADHTAHFSHSNWESSPFVQLIHAVPSLPRLYQNTASYPGPLLGQGGGVFIDSSSNILFSNVRFSGLEVDVTDYNFNKAGRA